MEITWEADPPQVRYSINVGLDEEDLDRLKQLAPSWPADHELKLSEPQEQNPRVLHAVWSFNTTRGSYDAPRRLLRDAGFQVVQDRRAVHPGAIYVAARGGVTALD